VTQTFIMSHCRSRKQPRFREGESVIVRSREEIMMGLDTRGRRDNCLMTAQMWECCGRQVKVLKVVRHLFDEHKGKLYRSNVPLYILDKTICHGRTDIFPKHCDRNCYLLWHEDWLDTTKGEKGVLYAENVIQTDKRLTACQLMDLHELGTISRVDDNLGFVRIVLKKIRNIVHTTKAKLIRSPAESLRHPGVGESDVVPGDRVIVRSKKEIQSMLDKEEKLDGCRFMRGMYKHCGKTYRVLNNVDSIFDEARKKMVRERQLVILDGATCSGVQRLFVNTCDRNCFFFWHKAWLQKVD